MAAPPPKVEFGRSMIGEFLAEFRQASYERIRNPLLAAFAVFVVAKNWQSFYIALFSDASLQERLALLEKSTQPWGWAVGFPAVLALAYVLAMPWIAYGIQKTIAIPTSRRKKHRIATELALLTDRRKLIEAEIANDRLRQNLTLEMDKQRKEHQFQIREREWALEERKLQLQNNATIHALNDRLQAAEDQSRKQLGEIRLLESKGALAARNNDEISRQLGAVQAETRALKSENTTLKNENRTLTRELAKHKPAT
jgi:hypothetical protein